MFRSVILLKFVQNRISRDRRFGKNPSHMGLRASQHDKDKVSRDLWQFSISSDLGNTSFGRHVSMGGKECRTLQLKIERHVSMGGNPVSGNDNRLGQLHTLNFFRFVKVHSSGVNAFKLGISEISNFVREDKPRHPNSTPSHPFNTNFLVSAPQIFESWAISLEHS
ncbi:hypothetical protein LOK49_LG14G01391 [Camellia lanceoleosa]|uniref:Uncharacterized protein n=1 Tax=Camellia lanceoleosa TaxID=1840588 RepID=A0ACC0FB20_9ERIC|nr:hypothetical protein LOK49_LG14G01391 [Camellia lanceoleosa]